MPDVLRGQLPAGTLNRWTKSRGIYQDEVTLMLLMLADIRVATLRILRYIEGDDEEEEDEDLPDA